MSLDYVSAFGTLIKPKEEVLMRQVIDGPQAEQLESAPVDRYSKMKQRRS